MFAVRPRYFILHCKGISHWYALACKFLSWLNEANTSLFRWNIKAVEKIIALLCIAYPSRAQIQNKGFLLSFRYS